MYSMTTRYFLNGQKYKSGICIKYFLKKLLTPTLRNGLKYIYRERRK